MSGWVRHGWREPPPPLNRASRCSPDSLPLSVFCQCSHGAADPGGERSIHRHRLDWSDHPRVLTMPMKPLYAGLITAAAIVGAILICVGCRRCQCARIKVQIARHRRDISTRQSRTQVGATGPATTTTAKQDDTSQASRTRRTRSSTSNTTTTARPARRARSFSSNRNFKNFTHSEDFSSARARTAAINEGSTSAGAFSSSATNSAPVTGVPKKAPRHAAAA